MKKILSIVVALFVGCFVLSAETHVEPGIRFSVLGVEPTIAVGINDLEIEAGFAFARDGMYQFDSQKYRALMTPNVTVGWNYDAFDTGWHNLVGFTYYCGIGYNKNATDIYHMAGLGYRGSIKFRNNFEICVRTNLPFVIIDPTADDPLALTIADAGGIYDCLVYGISMTSVGFRFSF